MLNEVGGDVQIAATRISDGQFTVPFHDFWIDKNFQALLSLGAKSRAKRTKRHPCLPRPQRLRFRLEATLVEVGAVVVAGVVQDVVGLWPGVVGVLLEAVQTDMFLAQTQLLSTVLLRALQSHQSLLSVTRLPSL